ncbi:hypothetical protein [Chryseobacterium mulctrae]|uniref:hypothetical protein n=1 Tax=Chryseobacterium mulctrae TaxID=2576777 RepID=UPI00111779A0|nr:hypothetical protein [Chryseobacterium mulctrae]
MKKILLFSLFIFLNNCGTCDHCDDPPVQYEYTIKNISGVKIEIIPHKKIHPGLMKFFYLKESQLKILKATLKNILTVLLMTVIAFVIY